jgi:hypothetical protein
MAFPGMGMDPNASSAQWVQQTMAQMRGGSAGAQMAAGLNDPSGQSSRNWVMQQMGQMSGGGSTNPTQLAAQYGIDPTGQSASQWVNQALSGGASSGGLGSLSGIPNLGALGANFGAPGALDGGRDLSSLLGTAGLSPATGFGPSPFGGLV